MGPKWNFEGRRRWQWMHDGMKPNGWIEFHRHGVLRTSLYKKHPGQWKLQTNDVEMAITFGNYKHLVSLLPQVEGQQPMFEVHKRVMKDGTPASGRQNGRATRGCLDME